MYLLETHTLFWWDSNDKPLSEEVRQVLEEARNTVFMSVVNIIEIQTKHKIGKLVLHKPLAEIITEQRAVYHFGMLPLTYDHSMGLRELPLHHRDSFDRLLIAQARHEDMTLLSRNKRFSAYDVDVLW